MGILSVRNLNKRFGGLQALNDVNLEVEEGTVHAIIGPNGAGKSTLLNCFVGRLLPDTGTVTVGVPHDQGNGAAPVDSRPPSFDSFGP